MKKNLKIVIISLLVIGLVGFSVVSSFAHQEQLTATVSVIKPVTFVVGESKGINFGAIEKPDTGESKTVIVSKLGNVSGSAKQIGNTAKKGTFTLSGADDVSISISIVDASCTTGLEIKDFEFSSTVTPTAAANVVVPHGATLKVDSNVKLGINECTYFIIANN